MVAITTRGLKQIATWWAVSPDGTGGDLFDAPVLIACRWEDRQETYIGQIDRREHVSKSIVYIDREIAVGDYLALGDQMATADPTSLAAADKAQRQQLFPDLRNIETQYRISL